MVTASTKEWITDMIMILGICLIVLTVIVGFGYMIISTENQGERIYSKCIDTCERVFQEQKLIECMQTCNQMGNQTIGDIRR
jgi:hypothetical protein